MLLLVVNFDCHHNIDHFLFCLLFPSLIVTCDVSKYEMRYPWKLWHYILMLQIALVQFLSNGIVKTKLVILTFLYWREFVKNPSAQLTGVTRLLSSVRFKNDKFSVHVISNDLMGQTSLSLYEYTAQPCRKNF